MRFIISRPSYTHCDVVKLFHARKMLGSTRERETTLSVLTVIHYLTPSLNMLDNPSFTWLFLTYSSQFATYERAIRTHCHTTSKIRYDLYNKPRQNIILG